MIIGALSRGFVRFLAREGEEILFPIAIRLSFVNIYNNISFNIVIFVYNVV